MKKLWLGILAITLVFGMTLVGCGGDPIDGDDGKSGNNQGTPVGNPPIEFKVTNTVEWENALTTIRNQGGGISGPPKNYIITINGDVGVSGREHNNSFGNMAKNITVTLKGNGKLYLTSRGCLFGIDSNQTVIIDSADLTLQGLMSGQSGSSQDNNESVVYTYGALELRNGTISGNATNSDHGVNVVLGTFTMTGGSISGNTSNSGSGVNVHQGTFTMSGGTISGNTVSVSSGSYYGGGGVYVVNSGEKGIFTKSGGTITGNASDTANGNVVKNSSGVVQGSRGHAVYVSISGGTAMRRETTAGPEVNIDSDVSGAAGGWE